MQKKMVKLITMLLNGLFGNGATQQNYGFPIPISSTILYGSTSSTANNSAPGKIIAAVIVNGQEIGSYITKPAGHFSTTVVFNPPIELRWLNRVLSARAPMMRALVLCAR